eukprot:749767-Hanusia_phi.AAC.1
MAGRTGKPRGILDNESVKLIYAERVEEKRRKTARSLELAQEYGVSAKAIRDIWNRRTWWHATQVLWTPEERREHESSWTRRSKPGRPPGSKDTKPRKCKRRTLEQLALALETSEPANIAGSTQAACDGAGHSNMLAYSNHDNDDEYDEEEEEDEDEEDCDEEDVEKDIESFDMIEEADTPSSQSDPSSALNILVNHLLLAGCCSFESIRVRKECQGFQLGEACQSSIDLGSSSTTTSNSSTVNFQRGFTMAQEELLQDALEFMESSIRCEKHTFDMILDIVLKLLKQIAANSETVLRRGRLVRCLDELSTGLYAIGILPTWLLDLNCHSALVDNA